MNWVKQKLIEWLGLDVHQKELNNLKKECEILHNRVQSYKASNKHFQNRLDKLEDVVRACSTVSSDMHMTHNKSSIVFIAGRYRNKDYVELFTVDDNSIPSLVGQLKHLEKSHSRGYYDKPFQGDISVWLDKEF